ncbi:hypothetical protein D9619_009748 [Psilocybe cf. subviscida]|uniref:Uncharacterized protein n=1 Tax=Psilocybe cf. subviscida TaxID=2480587 RepID=A0A8H5BLQ5_9AGAR|nr:hypothetical protein D9619_009748 [Psilocybe cf. subviscida]
MSPAVVEESKSIAEGTGCSTNTNTNTSTSTRTRTRTKTRPNFNIVNGHDYTNAEFEETYPEYKDEELAGLPEIHPLTLLRLATRRGPGRKYRGYGWRDLFAEKTEGDYMKWIGLLELFFLLGRRPG